MTIYALRAREVQPLVRRRHIPTQSRLVRPPAMRRRITRSACTLAASWAATGSR